MDETFAKIIFKKIYWKCVFKNILSGLERVLFPPSITLWLLLAPLWYALLIGLYPSFFERKPNPKMLTGVFWTLVFIYSLYIYWLVDRHIYSWKKIKNLYFLNGTVGHLK